jgi:ligand-binding SRPBCC domain-containing protein
MSEDEYRFFTVRRHSSRIVVEEVAWVLNCTPDDVHWLTHERHLRALGNPPVNGRKYYHTKEIFALAEDAAWLCRITNAIYKRSRIKNASRKSNKLLNGGNTANAA